MFSDILWIFFDMGSTLVDEQQAFRHRVRDAIQGTDIREEQLESVVGLNLDDVEKAYVRYVETDFGADDVYIILPKDGEDENGNSHHENVLAALRERKDDRIREFVNYDVYNSSAIAENAVIFERGGYVVMLMLEDNDSARRIVERYIPEKLNLS